MLYTAPPLGTNLARLGLEFCWGSAVSQACLTDAFIGHVHLRAYMSSSPPCAYISMLLSMLLLCFYGFRRCCTAPPLGINLARLGLEFCWGSAVSQACLTDAFIGHVHVYAPICPAIRHASIYPCFCPCFLFLRVSKMLYGTASGNQFGTPWARILLGFRCFASMPHGRVHRPCPPTCLYVQLSAMRLYIHAFVHAFAVFLRVSKMLYGTASGMNLARLGLECCWGSAVSQACLTDAFIGHVHLPCAYVQLSAMRLLYARFCFVFTGFEDAVRHRLWG